jgi:lauroyl/myristoyl acyltransferase
MTSRDRRLEAPHRRLEPGSRVLERSVVISFKTVAWIAAHIPPSIPRFLIARGAQLSYLLWPSKRHFSNLNYGHVLGLPPGHRRVRWTVLGAYGEYARYVVETMRLPHLPIDGLKHLVPWEETDRAEKIWRESEGGLIFALGHIGNPEVVAGAIASRNWPVSVLADDSSFPEMFEVFRQTRERLGVHVIPWRNLREIYGVLKKREMLGLLIDWGYRFDGIPVRLFGAWTTLPAGPAQLAAKTKSRILPVAIRRKDDDRTFHIELGEPISVASSAPADLLAATQRLADSLQEAIAAAPDQWYSFKPMWPTDPAEIAALEVRAAEMAANAPGSATLAEGGAEPGAAALAPA